MSWKPESPVMGCVPGEVVPLPPCACVTHLQVPGAVPCPCAEVGCRLSLAPCPCPRPPYVLEKVRSLPTWVWLQPELPSRFPPPPRPLRSSTSRCPRALVPSPLQQACHLTGTNIYSVFQMAIKQIFNPFKSKFKPE